MSSKKCGGGTYARCGVAILSAIAFSIVGHGATLSADDVVIENDISVSASSGGNTVSGTVHVGQSSAEASVRSSVNGVVVEDFHKRVESASGSPATLTHELSSTTAGAHIETSVRLEVSASAGTSTPNEGTPQIRAAAHVQKKPSVTVFPPSPNPKKTPHIPKTLSGTSTSVQQQAGVAQNSKPAREVRARGGERNFFLAQIINAIHYVRTIFRR